MSEGWVGGEVSGAVVIGEIWAGAGRGSKKKADSSSLPPVARRNDKGEEAVGRRNDRGQGFGVSKFQGFKDEEEAGEGARAARAYSAEEIQGMTPKELGELAEAEFLRAVLKMGMAVAKPWGESRGYDFIVDDEGKLCRVQVKAAFRQGRQGGYSLRAYRSSEVCYTEREIDALAGYAAPVDAWYLFPVRVIRKLKSLKLFPGSKRRRSKMEKWREAWWVVRK